jgi:hypothetical protein
LGPTARQIFISSPHSDPDQQAELEQSLIAWIHLPNRVYKTTFRHRLDDLNELVRSWLPEGRPLRIMDTAISTGITTLEWMENLERHGIEHFVCAGDVHTHAYLFSVGDRLHAFVDEAGRTWQLEINGKAMPNPPGKRNWLRHFPTLFRLKLGIRRWFKPLREAARKQGHQPVQKGRFGCHPLPLVHARLRQLPNVRVIEDDLCVHNPVLDQQFHVVRAANILNKCYFDDSTLTTILFHLRSRLKSGGLLVICRTDEKTETNDAINNGTIFRLEAGGKFTAIARIGLGSEIEDLVLSLG